MQSKSHHASILLFLGFQTDHVECVELTSENFAKPVTAKLCQSYPKMYIGRVNF